MLSTASRCAVHPSHFLRLKISPRELPPLPPSVVIHSSAAITDRKSTFQGHAVRVKDLGEALIAFSHIQSIKKVSKASHHIIAYRFSSPSRSGFDDGGEATAGRKLLRLLEMQDAQDVLVVVNRWYGGVQLGNDRFKFINAVAKEALEKGGWTSKAGA